ncbi:hypothetical protein LEP1GSC198_0975 [Leptospira kirschneri str. JB]|nr:hypothetical protein LEP1GSC198_0975 [Leptospira kirschneri str. JB]
MFVSVFLLPQLYFYFNSTAPLVDLHRYQLSLSENHCLEFSLYDYSTTKFETLGQSFSLELSLRKTLTPSIRYLFYSEFFSFHPFFGIYEMKFAPRDCLVFRVSHFNLLGKFSGPVYHSSNCSEKSDSTSY